MSARLNHIKGLIFSLKKMRAANVVRIMEAPVSNGKSIDAGRLLAARSCNKNPEPDTNAYATEMKEPLTREAFAPINISLSFLFNRMKAEKHSAVSTN